MKIARWDRNKSNPSKQRTLPEKHRVRSRHRNWDTTGLLRQLEVWEKQLSKATKKA